MKNGPYELIIAPPDYPGKRYRDRYAYEHHVVYWKKHGKIPGPGEVIHHKNHKKRDNRLVNLELITVIEHNKHYAKPPSMGVVTCKACGREFERQLRKIVGPNNYCNIKCQHKGLLKINKHHNL